MEYSLKQWVERALQWKRLSGGMPLCGQNKGPEMRGDRSTGNGLLDLPYAIHIPGSIAAHQTEETNE
jgi:hypothetical protein